MLQNFLMAEATAILGFLAFTYLTAVRSKYTAPVNYSPQLRTIRRCFMATVLLLFHQLAFRLWGLTILGFLPTTPELFLIGKFGGMMCLAGLALYYWALAEIHHYVLPPMSVASAGEAVLVKDGPYRFSRNPMYVSYWLTSTGIQLLTLSPLILLSPLVLLTFRGWVLQEEIDQLKLHGEKYVEYIYTTPRWFSLSKCFQELYHSFYLY